MTLLLSHMTAADFWRKVYSTERSPSAASPYISREPSYCSAEEIWSLAPQWITPRFLQPEKGVVHVTVREKHERRRSATHRCHLWQGEFPENAFYKLNDNVYVASPAFTFLQLGRDANLAQLIAFGNELCGLYSFDSETENGLRQRSTPLLTKEQLRCFVADAKGARGQAKAQAALRFIVERSGSPQETVVEMLQCLPYRYGGYGLPVPKMNHKLPLTAEAATIAKRTFLVADFYWNNQDIVLEYLGEGSHADTTALHSDRARTIALSLMNYTVLEITSRQVSNLASFETVTLNLAKMLGKRISSDYKGSTPQRIELRRTLFEWNQQSGRL